MNYMPSQFEVQQLRFKNLQKTVESIAVIIASLFISAILPSILIRYYYASQQLLEQPKLLEYIPVAAFVIGVGYFVWALFTNMLREQKARRLEAEIRLMGDMGCNCDHEHHHEDDDLAELEALVEEAAAKVKPAKSASKSKSKKKTLKK